MAADLLIKLTVTPLMMWGVSRAARRWGGATGGLLSGLPLTSGPISIYLAVEQGSGFAARAAVTAISGVAATIVFYVVYAAGGAPRAGAPARGRRAAPGCGRGSTPPPSATASRSPARSCAT